MSRSLAAIVAFGLATQFAFGQAVVVGHYPTGTQNTDVISNGSFVDITGSAETATVPAGTAVITWNLYGSLTQGFVRPAIGNDAPPTVPDAAFGGTTWNSGSWSTTTQGRTISIRLQFAATVPGQNMQYQPKNGTWTLVVFPAAQGAPAVGGIGPTVLVVLMLGIGGAIIIRRNQPVTTVAPAFLAITIASGVGGCGGGVGSAVVSYQCNQGLLTFSDSEVNDIIDASEGLRAQGYSYSEQQDGIFEACNARYGFNTARAADCYVCLATALDYVYDRL